MQEIQPRLIIDHPHDAALYDIVSENARVATLESVSPKLAWDEPSRPFHHFAYAFDGIAPHSISNEGGILSWLQNAVRTQGGSFVFNCMGGTNMLEDLAFANAITAGVALGLHKYSDPELIRYGIRSVPGDVLLQSAWESVGASMNELDIPGFTAIFFYPQNGGRSEYLSDNPAVTWKIFELLYALLAPRGVLFAEETDAFKTNNTGIELWRRVHPIDPDALIRKNCSFSLLKTERLPEFPEYPFP